MNKQITDRLQLKLEEELQRVHLRGRRGQEFDDFAVLELHRWILSLLKVDDEA